MLSKAYEIHTKYTWKEVTAIGQKWAHSYTIQWLYGRTDGRAQFQSWAPYAKQ